MRTGARIGYQLRIRGVPIRWESEITAWEPPDCFVDEQRSGPYRQWIHEHSFHGNWSKCRHWNRLYEPRAIAREAAQMNSDLPDCRQEDYLPLVKSFQTDTKVYK